jgi:endoglucanase
MKELHRHVLIWILFGSLLLVESSTLAVAGIEGAESVPPLHTDGRYILDGQGSRVKLASVNWYGAEELDYVVAGLEIEDLQAIAQRIKSMGFNSVRLPWSNELYARNPMVNNRAVAANPALMGKYALDVFDAVVDALAQEGLLVILDNHMSRADWCCSSTDGNGLWYTTEYPEATWIAHWQGMVERYLSQPAVVGADLRNEPRCVVPAGCAVWGGGNPALDWHAAAERGGNAVLDVNPDLLIIVEGIQYAANLTGARTRPVRLSVENRLVYSAHDYAWFHRLPSRDQLRVDLDRSWGYLLEPDQLYTAPVWVGEFGTCHDRDAARRCIRGDAPFSQGLWFSSFHAYLDEKDIDWAYWAVNGTQARGTGRTFGAEETYGIFNTAWSAPALPELLEMLQAIALPSQNLQ